MQLKIRIIQQNTGSEIMQTLLRYEVEDEVNASEKSAEASVKIQIDCRGCDARREGCHRNCPQMKALETQEGIAVTGELLKKAKRARIHKTVNVTFGKFMNLVGERDG